MKRIKNQKNKILATHQKDLSHVTEGNKITGLHQYAAKEIFAITIGE